MSYGAFLEEIMLRFAPELYLHSRMVAAACRAVCALILEEEPDFFDDMEGIADEADPAEKRRRLREKLERLEALIAQKEECFDEHHCFL